MLRRARKQDIYSELSIFENVDVSYGSKDERYYRDKVLHFVSQLPKEGRLLGLEIGCGTGVYTHHFAEFNKIEIVGMDLSENMLKIAKAKYPHIRFEQDNIEDLKYEDSMFDFCVGFNIVHHFPYKTKLFRNIARVLKAGGIFYCEEPNSLHLIPLILWSFKDLLGLNYTINEFPINPYQVSKVAAKFGLEWVDTFPINAVWNVPNNIKERISLLIRRTLNSISLMLPVSFVNSYNIGLLYKNSL